MKRIIPFFALLVLFSYCAKENKRVNPVIGQELLFINQEMAKKNYDNVVKFIDEYFKKNDITVTNAKLLIDKAEALKKIINYANKKDYKNRKEIAKQYGLKIKNKQLYYDYQEYKDIWKNVPDSKIGRESFVIWLSYLEDNDSRIAYLEKFLDKVKDEVDLKMQLANLYMDKIGLKKDKYIRKCLLLFSDIAKTANDDKDKSVAWINSIILQYLNDKNIEKFKNNLESYSASLNIHKSVKYYLLSEILFMKGHLKESLSDLRQAMRFLKKDKSGDDEVPMMLVKIKEIPEKSKDALKYSIEKKSNLIQTIIEYRNSIKNEKIGYIIGSRVRVRKSPLINKNNIITSLNTGDKVIIVKTSDTLELIKGKKDYWYQVKLKDGTYGWIFGKYITIFIE